MKKEVLYSQIMSLKYYKRGMPNSQCAIDLIKASGYVNILDMLLLPLYYMWEYLKYGTLEDVCFESYLKRSYRRFYLSAKSYIFLYVLMLKKILCSDHLSVKTNMFVMSLTHIYLNIVELLSNNKERI